MKKIISLMLILMMLFTLAACNQKKNVTPPTPAVPDSDTDVDVEVDVEVEAESEESTVEAIEEYIDIITGDLLDLENEFRESYASVSLDNYVDDSTMYEELTSNTVVLGEELLEAAEEIMDEITNDEVADVHNIYIEYAEVNLDAIETVIEALEEQDEDLIEEANDLLTEGTELGEEFADALNALMAEYGVTL